MESVTQQQELCFRHLENVWQKYGYDEESCKRERDKVEMRVLALLQQIAEENGSDKMTAKKEIFEKFQEEPLCMPLEKSFSDPLSTEEKLKMLKQFVKQKEGEKDILSKGFGSVKEVIDTIGKEIDWAKSLVFEHKLICNTITSVFTKESKEKLEVYHRKLEEQLRNRKSLLQGIHTKLASVWQSLNKDICDRKSFCSDLNDCAGASIDAIREELVCLEDIRKSKYYQFVEFTRKELDCWWTKCFYSEEQKKEFSPFFSTEYTEELLQLHEQELGKVKSFYSVNSGIFKLLHQWQKLWNMMVDIESKVYDPSRLFDNRGGHLLQEEKEKKIVAKDLPKVEEQLLRHAKSYKQQNGCDFLVNGIGLSNFVKRQKIDYQNSKEQRRLERKLAREQERLLDATAGVNSITKGSCRKRKYCGTPNADIASCKRPMLRSLQSVSHSGKVLRPIQNTIRSGKTAKKVLCMNGPESRSVYN